LMTAKRYSWISTCLIFCFGGNKNGVEMS
jgi:hypothetical protein